jgi:hypothetical protein
MPSDTWRITEYKLTRPAPRGSENVAIIRFNELGPAWSLNCYFSDSIGNIMGGYGYTGYHHATLESAQREGERWLEAQDA